MSSTALRSTLPPGAGRHAADRLVPPKNPFLKDPAKWMHDKLGRCLWSKQVEILNAVRDHRLVAVRSCHGPGKSFTGSGTGSWWLDVHELGSAFLVTTAPSWPQVESILWREIRRRYNEGKLPGRITLDCQWHRGATGAKRGDATEELIGMGRKPADYDDSTFQGIHARYFMALLDEAGGIPESLWNSVLALATNEHARIVALGNPDDPASRFAQVCKEGSGWHVIGISVWETPNFTGEKDCAVCGKPLSDEILESLVSKIWVEDRRRDWGEGTPIWISKVEGEFPDISEDYLFPPRILEIAKVVELPGFELGRYGLDISRFGDSRSALYRYRGGQIRLTDLWGMMDTVESKNKAIPHFMFGAIKIPATVDSTGVGGGVYDMLRHEGFPVSPYYGAERPRNPKKFRNRRSEVYWEFREMMADGLVDLDPADEKLFAQLGTLKWGVMPGSDQIYVETKEDMRKRGLPSPDHADAAVLSTVEQAMVIRDQLPREPSSIAGDLLTKVM